MHRVDVSFPYFTGLPSDVTVNTFHFLWLVGSPVLSDYVKLMIDIEAFYTATFTSISQAGAAPWVTWGAVTETIYDLADPVPRTPVYTDTRSYAVTQSTSASTSPETAVCLSYEAAKVSGLPQARRRGRIFVGGLGACTTPGTVSTFPVPSPTLITNLTTAAQGLLASSAADGWEWNVWSRVDQAGSAVVGGWVDNAFDTQRRRGQGPSARTTW